jgi:uncharacterized protein
MSGEVVHLEMPADDVERARKFYKKTFGWKMQPIPELDYTMVQTAPGSKRGMPTEPETINGGMAKRGGPLKHPVVTIMVPSIDRSLKTISKNGGRVVRKKTPIGAMGYAAYFSDSEGNVVGLSQVAKG